MSKLHRKTVEVETGNKWEWVWTIRGWAGVRVEDLDNLKASFWTGLIKWQVGLKEGRGPNAKVARPYWQLVEASDSEYVKVHLRTHLWDSDSKDYDECFLRMRPGDIYVATDVPGVLICSCTNNRTERAKGHIESPLYYTLRLDMPKDPDATIVLTPHMTDFVKMSLVVLRGHFAALLDQNTEGDLSIVTDDGTVIQAHTLILKTRCPVFARKTMSSPSDQCAGTVHVAGVSGKTMNILLRYFYTGELLSGWNDADTVVDFVTAAGKYQVTKVLAWLDTYLGTGAHAGPHVTCQLLNLSGKLGLKHAEMRLLQNVCRHLKTFNSCEEVLVMFGCDTEELSKTATVMAEAKIGQSNVFDLLNTIFGGTPIDEMSVPQRGVMTLVALIRHIGSLKFLETVVVEQVADVVGKCKSAAEVFAFVGECK